MTETKMKNFKTEDGTSAGFRQRNGKTRYIVHFHIAGGKKTIKRFGDCPKCKNDNIQKGLAFLLFV